MLFSLVIFLTSVALTLAAPQPVAKPPQVNYDARVRSHDAAPLGPDGSVIDTPEVIAAKQQHFAAYNGIYQTLSRLQLPNRLQNTRKDVNNINSEASNIFSGVAPERFNVAHNTRPEENDLNINKINNIVQPERFSVAHNVKPEERSLTVNKNINTEDAVDRFVAGLNLGRLNSYLLKVNKENKINNSEMFEEALKTLAASDNKSYEIHLNKPNEQIISFGSEPQETVHKPEVTRDGFTKDSPDVVKAKSEHLAAHAEQVSIHEALHRTALKSEEARNKEEYLAELDRKIGAIKDVLQSKKEIVQKPDVTVKGEGFLKVLSEHLAAQAEQVAIHNAAIKSNEDTVSKRKSDDVAKVEVSAQGYIQDTEDVANAKAQHLALHAEQVALHNVAVKAANAVENNMTPLTTTPKDLSNVLQNVQMIHDKVKEPPKSENLISTGTVLNLVPGNVGIVISFDTQQAENDFENLSIENQTKENQTQFILVSHDNLKYPNVNIEINLNGKYIKVYPGSGYIEPDKSDVVNVNNPKGESKIDGKCDQKEDDSIIYIAKPVSVSEYKQGGLLSNRDKNYFEIADFLHHHKHGSLENEKGRDNLKFFTP